MADKKITSVADLIKELKAAQKANHGPAWYRGHADATWKLLPQYDRLKNPPLEMDLLGRFRQNANLLLENAPTEALAFSWMFLMQHYGVPTRLLDWSESPLVALYFVVDDSNPKNVKKDGAVWMLYPRKLNEHSTKQASYIPSFDDSWLANYSVEEYDKGKDNGILPLAAIATRNNSRIQAQLGVFTISHRKKTPIEGIEGGEHCVKLIVPAHSKDAIRKELNILGIGLFQMFPELSSIGANLKAGLK